jgi:hypothetical protein
MERGLQGPGLSRAARVGHVVVGVVRVARRPPRREVRLAEQVVARVREPGRDAARIRQVGVRMPVSIDRRDAPVDLPVSLDFTCAKGLRSEPVIKYIV